MRFFQNVLSRALVTGLGETSTLSEATVKRRDTEVVELQLFSGSQGIADPYQLEESFEMIFAAKVPDDWSDWAPSVVMSSTCVSVSYTSRTLPVYFLPTHSDVRFSTRSSAASIGAVAMGASAILWG